MTTDKEGVKILVDVLAAQGVRHAVLSPGSRNAPLLVAFAREQRIRHYVVVDERSAAFFALGVAQRSGEAVALVCTSGTAVLNYAPAVAEAYYQRLPLVVVSADRPVAWVDQDDSQTIRQREVLRNIVKASYEIPGEARDGEERWYANRIANEAVCRAMRGRRGPVHVNVPLREPLYGLREYDGQGTRMVGMEETEPFRESVEVSYFAGKFLAFSKVMILLGSHLPDAGLQEALRYLSEWDSVVVLAETTGNVRGGRCIGGIDRVLAAIPAEERETFAPELLITLGGPLVSRQVKAFFRKYPPRECWRIDRSDFLLDTFQCLTTQVDMEDALFFHALCRYTAGQYAVRHSGQSDFAERWQQRHRVAMGRHEKFGEQVGWCDWKAFSMILPALPAGVALQLANSTPVRYAQLFDCSRAERVDANRGTSGIDGSTSTAVGAAVLNPGVTVLITGDISFLYDSNALWNKYLESRFKIIVIKNGGGAIFRFIDGPSHLEELEECFETPQRVDVQGFAALHGFACYRAGSGEELREVLPSFWQEDKRPAMLVVDTAGCPNAERLKEYFKELSD